MTFEQWAWGRGFSLPQMDVAKMAWEAALKAQAGEPVAWAIYISGEPSDVFMHKQFAELECARRDKLYPDPTRQFVPLFTHPTTERRVIPEDVRKVMEMVLREVEAVANDHHHPRYTRLDEAITALRNALNAAPAPTKFQLGDKVRKTKGSQWHGKVVGTYSTTLTPEGYAVESSTEIGSVQIYPAAALEDIDD